MVKDTVMGTLYARTKRQHILESGNLENEMEKERWYTALIIHCITTKETGLTIARMALAKCSTSEYIIYCRNYLLIINGMQPILSSGNIYEGEWKHNKQHEVGTMHWFAKGEVYTGEWLDGFQHGVGTHLWTFKSSDSSQVGYWIEEKKI